MYRRIQLGVFAFLLATIIGKCTINADDVDELIHCKDEEIVTGHLLGEIQMNCSSELHTTPENTTCISVCLLKHLDGVDESGRPTKEKFDKIVDEKAASALREKMKKTDCFDKVPKIQEGSDLCKPLLDFEGCFEKMMGEICKPISSKTE